MATAPTTTDKRCAFLTLADPAGYFIDDQYAYAPLAALGWQIDAVPWRTPDVDWDDYDLVVIRSTWDYHDHTDEFLATLARIDASGARLENPLDIVHWNLNKTYLRDLAGRGVAIVPTLWRDALQAGDLPRLFAELGADEIVVKPQIGANAHGAFRLRRDATAHSQVCEFYQACPLMAQPLVRGVLTEGEYSLFYFHGEYSHAILKTPDAGDFRSQEEHGATIRSVQPDAALLAAGAQVLAALGRDLLYVRADFVPCDDKVRYWLIELELIEPSLYLRTDNKAPERFASALDRATQR